MLYEVTLRGPRNAEHPHGTIETVTIEADSGDDAAAKAFKPYRIVCSVQPAAQKADVAVTLQSLRHEYQSATGKRPFNGWNESTLRQKLEAA